MNTSVYRNRIKNFFKRLALSLLITMLAAGIPPAFQASAAHVKPLPALDVAAIDAFIQNEMDATHLPGLALAIVHEGDVVYLKGYGVADESGNPVTPQTPFMLASVSKSFTALAVMQLVEAGKVNLDAPVQTYLPWFRVADEAASRKITVRMLLNHTSGIPGSAGMEFFAGDSDRETQVRALAHMELDRPVGESYEYANPTYATLALIVQEVSGQPFEEYVQGHIFKPLEMTNTFTSQDEAMKHGMATAHTFAFGMPVALNTPNNRGGLPYCCIISSAEDLSHYLIAQMNGGNYGNTSVLSPQGMDMMHAPAVIEDRPDRIYGMAWEVRTINNIPVVMHTGEGVGWQSNLIMLPDSKWGIAVIMNGYDFVDGNFGADALRGIARGVTSLVAGQNPPQTSSGSGALIFYGVLLTIILVQAAGMARSVKAIKRWSNERNSKPRKLLNIYLPLILNLLWAGLMLLIAPNVLMPYALMKLLVPALAYTLLFSGWVALLWAFARTFLVSQTVRKVKDINAKSNSDFIGSSA